MFVWIVEGSIIDSFQLCYVRAGSEYALTWTRGSGARHDLIDDGQRVPTRNRTPIMVPCAEGIADNLLQRFLADSADIDPDIRRVIVEQLRAAACVPPGANRQLHTTGLAGDSLS